MADKKNICACCEQEVDEDFAFTGEEGTHYDGETLCEMCFYEGQTEAVIRLNPSNEDIDDCEATMRITSTMNETAEYGYSSRGRWKTKWHSTDAWRGYYEVEAPENWKLLNADASLWGLNESVLANFHNPLVRGINGYNIPLALVSCVTSNVFSTAVDWFVYVEDTEQVARVAWILAAARVAADYDSYLVRDMSEENVEHLLARDIGSADIAEVVGEMLDRDISLDDDIAELAEDIMRAMSSAA
jgi:hypothetical protein